MGFSEHLHKHFSEDAWETDNKDSEKLKKVVNICKRTISHFNSDCGSSPYAAGRCITAEQILELLESEA
jgi:hypothetical protein